MDESNTEHCQEFQCLLTLGYSSREMRGMQLLLTPGGGGHSLPLRSSVISRGSVCRASQHSHEPQGLELTGTKSSSHLNK